jgi:hypothetical protein
MRLPPGNVDTPTMTLKNAALLTLVGTICSGMRDRWGADLHSVRLPRGVRVGLGVSEVKVGFVATAMSPVGSHDEPALRVAGVTYLILPEVNQLVSGCSARWRSPRAGSSALRNLWVSASFLGTAPQIHCLRLMNL